MKRLLGFGLSAAVAVALGYLFLMGGVGGSATYIVDRDPDLVTKLSPENVAETVLDRLVSMERGATAWGEAPASTPARILKVASRRADDVRSVEPNSAVTTETGAVWIVRAEGTFIQSRGLLDSGKRIWSTGYFLIDDATGMILAMGMP